MGDRPGAPDDAGRRSGPKTLDEIAAATGFSRTTVRFVVSGEAERHRIKAETRALIEAHVAAHGLVVDHTARSLKTRRSDAVGLVVPDLANAFFARLTAELEDRCRATGRVLLTASTHEDPDREAQAVAGLLGRGVDGLVVAPCRPPAAFRAALRGRRTAVVMVDRAHPAAPWPTIVGDNRAAAEALTRGMIDIVGGSLAVIAAGPQLPSIAERLDGIRAAATAAGLGAVDTRIHLADRDEVDAGTRLMEAAIAAHGTPAGVISSSLMMLEGVFQALVRLHGRLPEKLVIATFDHHPLLDVVPNRILSVRQDEAGLAEAAFARLVDLMEGGSTPAGPLVVPGRLVDRPALGLVPAR